MCASSIRLNATEQVAPVTVPTWATAKQVPLVDEKRVDMATEDQAANQAREIEGRVVRRGPCPELAPNFSETARILFAAGSVTDTLAQVVELAVATIEGCDFAGLFLLENDVVTSPVHTDPIVNEIDALQHQTGEGPCLDAITHGSSSTPTTWPTTPAGPASAPRRARSGYAVFWRFR